MHISIPEPTLSPSDELEDHPPKELLPAPDLPGRLLPLLPLGLDIEEELAADLEAPSSLLHESQQTRSSYSSF